MFGQTSSFKKDWDISGATYMLCMLTTLHRSICDVSNVNDTRNMFNGAYSFNQDLSQWNMSNVCNMSHMFYDACYQDISGGKFQN